MKTFAFALLIFLLPTTHKNIKKSPLQLKFDKVIMYDFSGGKGWNPSIVDDKGQLATSITKQVNLDKESAINLSRRLGEKKSFGGGSAACFEPHLGFVYYLDNKIVAHITICLGCNVLVSSIPLDAQKQGKVGQGKDVYYLGAGPSKIFRKFLNGLLKKHNFSHQLHS